MTVLKFDIVHASLNTFMSDADNVADVRRLLKKGALYYTFTELEDIKTVRLVKDLVHKEFHDYETFNPDAGDIYFVARKDFKVSGCGGHLAIPGTHGIGAADGGHGPRFNSYLAGDYEGEHITHTGVHTVVAKPDNKPHMDRRAQQIKQLNMMGDQMQKFGVGKNLAIGSGDINAEIPHLTAIQHVFDAHKLTTTSEETGNREDTHGTARLDYIWTYDADSRLSVPKMDVLRNQGYHSDHDPVVATINVKAKKKAA